MQRANLIFQNSLSEATKAKNINFNQLTLYTYKLIKSDNSILEDSTYTFNDY